MGAGRAAAVDGARPGGAREPAAPRRHPVAGPRGRRLACHSGAVREVEHGLAPVGPLARPGRVRGGLRCPGWERRGHGVVPSRGGDHGRVRPHPATAVGAVAERCLMPLADGSGRGGGVAQDGLEPEPGPPEGAAAVARAVRSTAPPARRSDRDGLLRGHGAPPAGARDAEASARLPAKARRGSRQRAEPLATIADLAVLAKLPVSALAAWCLPEQRWEAVAARPRCASGARSNGPPAGSLRCSARTRRHPNGAGPPPTGACPVGPALLPAQLPSWRVAGGDAAERSAHLDDALLAGRGAVLWVAPTVFQWLPAKRTLFEAGYRVHHLSSPQHGFSGRSWLSRASLNPIRTRVEDRYLAERVMLGSDGQAHSALRRLGSLLAENAVVSITMAPARTRSIRTPLLRGFFDVAAGPSHLAMRSGAALLPVVTLARLPAASKPISARRWVPSAGSRRPGHGRRARGLAGALPARPPGAGRLGIARASNRPKRTSDPPPTTAPDAR